MGLIRTGIRMLEKDCFPDPVIRWGIRRLLSQKLKYERRGGAAAAQERLMALIAKLQSSPVAVDTEAANEQHYELPPQFFRLVLGKRLKYSSCFYPAGCSSLDEAEEEMLRLTMDRADLANGQDILELGCGWGSLTLRMAEQFPESRITAVSNSNAQRELIEEEAQRRELKNLRVITADMNDFHIDQTFDRVVSVEMFEHMRNYQTLMARISGFLKDDGRLFVHIFTHKDVAYLYETAREEDFIGRYFFSGGVMPSDHLLLYFAEDLRIERHWRVNGSHYQKTANDWLKNMDAHREEILPILKTVYGQETQKWRVYWRVFFMSCAELWGFRGGEEWMVSHYLFRKRKV